MLYTLSLILTAVPQCIGGACPQFTGEETECHRVHSTYCWKGVEPGFEPDPVDSKAQALSINAVPGALGSSGSAVQSREDVDSCCPDSSCASSATNRLRGGLSAHLEAAGRWGWRGGGPGCPPAVLVSAPFHKGLVTALCPFAQSP